MTTPKKNQNWILLTSGPTRAYFDRVRYIANSSTGALGARIAETLVKKGANLLHIRGKGSISPEIKESVNYRSCEIETIGDLTLCLKKLIVEYRIAAVIHSMAVLDYCPGTEIDGKKSSADEYWDIRLVKTPKISGIIKELLPETYMVGFKLETGMNDTELAARAFGSLKKYDLDIVVANDMDKVKTHSHEAIFVDKSGNIFDKAYTKEEIAEKISSLILRNVFSETTI